MKLILSELIRLISKKQERNFDYRIIEKKQKLIEDERYIYGSAADINTLM